jgi:hypothetical protein
MSYAFKTIEIEEPIGNKQSTATPKLFAVTAPTYLADKVTRRVVEVVNFELAQGSMPA